MTAIVEGESGIGKTALVKEASNTAYVRAS
jgi:predicted ATPase